jgi:hypothetical protein
VSLAPGGLSGSATLSWNTNGDSGCTLTSSDGQYGGGALGASPVTLTIPAADAGSIVKYTVSCSSGPAASTVYAYVNVYPPPTLSVMPAAILQGGGAVLTYNTNHAQGCVASTTDGSVAFSGALSGMNSIPLNPAMAGSYTYNLACSSPATNLTANLSVVAAPTVGVSNPGSPAGAALTILQGSGATLTWNGTGSTGCSWSSTDGSFVAPAGSSGSTNVNPAKSGTYTYTYACTGPAPTSQTATLVVVQQPTVSVSPATVTQNTAGATLSWNSYLNNGCGWTSTDGSFTAPAAASGSMPVNPPAPGPYSYTLTCAAPTQPATATLTVNAAAAPAISVSPNSITQGGSSTLAWTINPGDACTGSNSGTDTNANDNFTGMIGVSGSRKITPNAAGTDTYSLNCTVPPVTETATLTVKPQLAVVSITVTPIYDLDIGDPGYVKWTLGTGAAQCTVSGTALAPFAVATSGQLKVFWNTAGVYTYTLSCSNPPTPVQTSVTITNDR